MRIQNSSFKPITDLPSKAISQAAVFDGSCLMVLPQTSSPNMTFWQYLWNPFKAKKEEILPPEPPFFSTRMAEEWAWRTANLQSTVLLLGGMSSFPSTLEPSYILQSNPDPVHKTSFIRDLLAKQSLEPLAFYFHSESYIPLLTTLPWKEVFLTQLEGYSQKTLNFRWPHRIRTSEIKHDITDPTYPVPVQEYARNVLRGNSLNSDRASFYQRWSRILRTKEFLSASLSVAGLYLKESEETKHGLRSILGDDFDQICFDLYEKFVQHRPEETTPLRVF